MANKRGKKAQAKRTNKAVNDVKVEKTKNENVAENNTEATETKLEKAKVTSERSEANTESKPERKMTRGI